MAKSKPIGVRFDLDKSTANNFSEKNNIIDTRNK